MMQLSFSSFLLLIFLFYLASNGPPNQPDSLHYMGPTPTLYERALQSVVSIIQDYDSDKHFPVLGFGAKIPPVGFLSHEFFVSLDKNPFCSGVSGTLVYFFYNIPFAFI